MLNYEYGELTKAEYYEALSALEERQENGEDISEEMLKLMQTFENGQNFVTVEGSYFYNSFGVAL